LGSDQFNYLISDKNLRSRDGARSSAVMT